MKLIGDCCCGILSILFLMIFTAGITNILTGLWNERSIVFGYKIVSSTVLYVFVLFASITFGALMTDALLIGR